MTMYFLRGNTISNNNKSDFNRRIEHEYKQQFGDNWRKGAEKAGLISQADGAALAKQRRAEMKQETQKKYAETVKSSIEQMAHRKQISGVQAQRLANIASRM